MEFKSCALTGHRKLEENFDINRLYDALEDLIKNGVEEFYCGMAIGFDLTSLKCLVDLKKKYKIKIIACIPFDGQEKKFKIEEQKEYHLLLTWCDEKKIISDHYSAGSFLKRNRYMVDRADVVLAYVRKETGGTAYTVDYAKKNNKEIYMI